MSSNYEKILEETNARLTSCLEASQGESDSYERYVDLLAGAIIEKYMPYGKDEESSGWTQAYQGGCYDQKLKLTISAKDFRTYPILEKKIDQYLKERIRKRDLDDQREIRNEKIQKVVLITCIALASVAAIWGLGWAIWWTYFVVV